MQFLIQQNGSLLPVFPQFPTYSKLGTFNLAWKEFDGITAIVHRQDGSQVNVTVSVPSPTSEIDEVYVHPIGMPEWPVSLSSKYFRMLEIDDATLEQRDKVLTTVQLYNNSVGERQAEKLFCGSFSMGMSLLLNNLVTADGVPGKIQAKGMSRYLIEDKRGEFFVFDWSFSTRPRLTPVVEVKNLAKDFEEIDVLGDFAKFYVRSAGNDLIKEGEIVIDYVYLYL